MHVHSSGSDSRIVDMAALVDEFRGDVGEEMQLKFEIVDEDVKLKTMLMVFKLEREYGREFSVPDASCGAFSLKLM